MPSVYVIITEDKMKGEVTVFHITQENAAAVFRQYANMVYRIGESPGGSRGYPDGVLYGGSVAQRLQR